MESKFLFPVAVLLLEHVDVLEPSKEVFQDGNVGESHIDQRWYKTAFAKMLCSNTKLPVEQRRDVCAHLLHKVFRSNMHLDYLYLATRLDPQFYKLRSKSPAHKVDFKLIEAYYCVTATCYWRNNESLLDLHSRYKQPSQKCQEKKQAKHTVTETLQPYVNQDPFLLDVVKQTYFGLLPFCPFNRQVTNDQDDSLLLGYDGHVMQCKTSSTDKSFYKIFPEEERHILHCSNQDLLSIRYIKEDYDIKFATGVTHEISLDLAASAGHFVTFNYMWHWTYLSHEQLKTKDLVTYARLAVGAFCMKVVSLNQVGKSDRQPNNENNMTSKTHFIDDPNSQLDGKFCQRTYEQPGLCVWLSMAILMNGYNPDVADMMIETMKKNLSLFSWLTSQGFAVSVNDVEMKEHDLPSILGIKDPSKIHKKKLSGLCLYKELFSQYNRNGLLFKREKLCSSGYVTYEDFINKYSGRFVLFLGNSMRNSTSKHAICVDTNTMEIYDPEEEYIMRLNKQSLGICMGAKDDFKNFTTVYYLKLKHDNQEQVGKNKKTQGGKK